MPEAPNGTRNVFGGVPLATVLQVVTIIAALAGQWAVLNERFNDLQADYVGQAAALAVFRGEVTALTVRLSVLERDVVNLRDIVIELRRQSGLREPVRP